MNFHSNNVAPIQGNVNNEIYVPGARCFLHYVILILLDIVFINLGEFFYQLVLNRYIYHYKIFIYDFNTYFYTCIVICHHYILCIHIAHCDIVIVSVNAAKDS